MKNKELSDKLAIILPFTCAILIVLCFGVLCFKRCQTTKVSEDIKLQVLTDTCSEKVVSTLSTEIVESLNMVLQRREQILAERYQNLLEQKERNEDFFSFGSFLIAIVVGILGFFGIKSFQEIRDKATETATNVAETRAKTTAKETAEETAKETAKEIAEEIAEEISKSIAAKIARSVSEKNSKTVAEAITEKTVRSTLTKKYVSDIIKGDFIEDIKQSIMNDLDSIIEEKITGSPVNSPTDNSDEDLSEKVDDLQANLNVLNEKVVGIEGIMNRLRSSKFKK